MGSTPDPSGDYGYDMAHQDVTAADRKGPPVPDAPPAPPARPGDDLAGDHGYDEAHGF